jgi:tungstate transport system ATP-binding protein
MSQSPTDVQPMIEAKDLSVSHGGQKVLDVPLLRVYRDEVLVIIGPNGSGKTTLLLCLTHLINPQTGTVSYQGVPITHGKAVLNLHRKVAVVFQESLLLNTSVWDNVTLGLRLRNIKGDEIKTRGQKWLERFGIAALAKRQARTLSSGEPGAGFRFTAGSPFPG